jgi:hypothetical protein
MTGDYLKKSNTAFMRECWKYNLKPIAYCAFYAFWLVTLAIITTKNAPRVHECTENAKRI